MYPVYERFSEAVLSYIESEIACRWYRADILTEDMFKFDMDGHWLDQPVFYLLLKVHKPGVPGRPIVSACGSTTEGLSEIVDHSFSRSSRPYLRILRTQRTLFVKFAGLVPFPLMISWWPITLWLLTPVYLTMIVILHFAPFFRNATYVKHLEWVISKRKESFMYSKSKGVACKQCTRKTPTV